MAYLSLDNALVLHASGLPAAISQAKFRMELSDDATLNLFRPGLFGESRVFSASLGMMALRTWTDVVQSGGGFIGGGFGLAGAAEGMLVASVLNALTSKRRAYALLGIFLFPLDGSKRELVIGFSNLAEAELKNRLAMAIPQWTESHVQTFLRVLHSHKITDPDAQAAYAQLAKAAELALLSRKQIETMWNSLAKVRPPNIKSPFAALDRTAPSNDRLARLKTLNELRLSGALTSDEFNAEKARILSESA